MWISGIITTTFNFKRCFSRRCVLLKTPLLSTNLGQPLTSLVAIFTAGTSVTIASRLSSASSHPRLSQMHSARPWHTKKSASNLPPPQNGTKHRLWSTRRFMTVMVKSWQLITTSKVSPPQCLRETTPANGSRRITKRTSRSSKKKNITSFISGRNPLLTNLVRKLVAHNNC